jgi:hypothetical protein
VLQREADDAPGDAGAVEVALRERVPVAFEPGGETETTIAHRRHRLAGDGDPRVFIDAAGRLEAARFLERGHCGGGVAAVHAVEAMSIEAGVGEMALEVMDDRAAGAAAEEQSGHGGILLRRFYARIVTSPRRSFSISIFTRWGDRPFPKR